MYSFAKEQARKKIAYDLKYTNEKKVLELFEEIRRLPAGSCVLVYRTKSKEWKVLFDFIHIDGETVAVEIDHGQSLFRSTCVKPIAKSLIPKNTRLSPDLVENISEAHTTETCIVR